MDPTTTPKPGYKTTEFWLKLAAILLTALFASGAIPTAGPAATVAAIAATMLGALGYTVARSMVKSAAAALVLMLCLAGSGAGVTACTPAQRTSAEHAVVDCVAGDAAAIGALAADLRTAPPAGCALGDGTDWGCVRGKAIDAGIVIGGCAFLQLVSGPAPAPTATARVASATGAPPADRPGRAAFESYRASVAGGASFRTAAGLR